MEGVAEEEEEEACDDESEGDIPFEPFDINDDGRILKTASQCSRGSWKRPEAGWDVTITVHRFCERSPPEATTGEANDTQEDDAAGADVDVPSSLPPVVSQVEPDFLQLAFRLGEDDDEGFPQVIKRDTAAPSRCFHTSICTSCDNVSLSRHIIRGTVITYFEVVLRSSKQQC